MDIEKYEAKLDAAITFEEKKMYADLITETRKTLNALLQQQQQGKLIIPSRLSLQHRCFEINPISWLTPHLTISFASFCNIAQTGGEQGELLCCCRRWRSYSAMVVCAGLLLLILFSHQQVTFFWKTRLSLAWGS